MKNEGNGGGGIQMDANQLRTFYFLPININNQVSCVAFRFTCEQYDPAIYLA